MRSSKKIEALRVVGEEARGRDLGAEAVARVRREAAVILAERREAGASDTAVHVWWRPVLGYAMALLVIGYWALDFGRWGQKAEIGRQKGAFGVQGSGFRLEAGEIDARFVERERAVRGVLRGMRERYGGGGVVTRRSAMEDMMARMAATSGRLRAELADDEG